MPFLSGLFETQVGGSPFGNFIRNIAHNINPALGNGAGLMTQKQEDIKELSDDLYIKKYGETKNGEKVDGVIANPNIKSTKQAIRDAGNDTKTITIKALIKKYWYIVLLMLIPFGLLIFWLIKKLFNKKKFRRY